MVLPWSERAGAAQGFVEQRFEPVRIAFEENFSKRRELGAACAIYQHGDKVVDLWGGVRNRETGDPWLEDTMVLVFSATKGLSAMTLALAHSRGWLDYDERVAAYWPEFAANGKAEITVRQLLAHQAGLFAFDAKVDRALIADPDRLAVMLAEQRPAWPAGERQSYHALSLGFYEGELIRRIDPQHRTLGRFFQDEIATPLGLDAFIRLPQSIPNSRLAVIQQSGMPEMMLSMPTPLLLASMNPHSDIYRSLFINPGPWVPVDPETGYARDLEIPSGGGVATARGLAKAYSAFCTAGGPLDIRQSTIDALREPARPARNGFFDDGIRAEVQFSLGFMKSSPGWPVGSPSAFGAPGAGGALAFADPETGIAYAYVANRMSAKVLDSARNQTLQHALATVISKENSHRFAPAGDD